MYSKYFKRVFDFVLALLALFVLSPVILVLIISGTIAMRGNPFFIQPRPGKKDVDGKEKIFMLIKFRSMSNKKDKEGNLLPDERRLNAYGKFLRSTSLDELGELWNIIKGDMSIVGPRPQLIKDLVFMSEEQRKRHEVKPGLTGLAQISGRNNITWEQKFQYDLEYIQNISLFNDMKIIVGTVWKVINRTDIVREGTASDVDFGDYLVLEGKINHEVYSQKQEEARNLLELSKY